MHSTPHRYNFSTSSFLIESKVGVTLSSGGADATVAMFVFGYNKATHDDGVPGPVQPGINISNSQRVSILGAAIDYFPKSRALFCNSRAALAPTGKVGLVHGNASVNEMLDNQRLWCGKKPSDKCGDFGSFPCPSAAACQEFCAGNASCVGATWSHPPNPLCYMLSALDTTDSEPGFSSWSRVPVAYTSEPCTAASGPGITLHMFNSSDTLVEDLTIHAEKYQKKQ